MKTLSFIIVVLVLSMNLSAQSQYEKAMSDALEKFGQAGTSDELNAAAAQFERISEVETKEWLPSYYASLVYCTSSFRITEPDKKKLVLDQAQVQLEKAMNIAPDESELYTLQGLIYQGYMAYDPMQYGQLYGPKANGAFQTAIKLNAGNPRPYYLQGVSIMHTPKEYGGGKQAALPLLEQALQLFEKEEPKGDFYPGWGKEDCEKNLELCKVEASNDEAGEN